MCISLFYAQVIGLWLFIVALAMIVHQTRLKKAFTETIMHPGLMTFSGFVTLGLGLLIAISHNIWVASWPVVVTLYGWVLIFQGVMRLFWPEHFSKMAKKLMNQSGYTVMSWVWMLVALYLLWAGFVA